MVGLKQYNKIKNWWAQLFFKNIILKVVENRKNIKSGLTSFGDQYLDRVCLLSDIQKEV